MGALITSSPPTPPRPPLASAFTVVNRGNVGASVKYSLTAQDFFTGAKVYDSGELPAGVFPNSTRTFAVNWDDSRSGIFRVEQRVEVDGAVFTKRGLVVTLPQWVFAAALAGVMLLGVSVWLAVRSAKARRRFDVDKRRVGRGAGN